MRSDDKLAYYAACDKNSATRVITLPAVTGGNVTPTELTPGYHYMCRCPGGTAAMTITGKLLSSGSNVADSTLDLPGTTEETKFCIPGDQAFLLYVDASAKYLAAVLNGGGPDTLQLMRVTL